MKLAFCKVLFFVAASLFCSCATMFNSNHTSITLIGNTSTKFIVNNDSSTNNIGKFNVERSRKPLTISVLKNDSLINTLSIKSRISKTVYLNLLFMYGIVGGIIDNNRPKSYSYPHYLFFDSEKSKFVKARPDNLELPEKNKILFKIAPLNMITNFSNPSVMVGAEIKNNSSFSTNFYLGYGFPILYQYGEGYQNFRFSIEQRKYLRNIVFNGTYIGFEFDYFNTKYTNKLEYALDDQTSKDYYEREYKEGTFDFNKKVTNYSVKLGYQFKKGKIYLDLISGIGVRYKKTVLNNNPNYKVYFNRWRHPNINDYNNEIGSVLGGNLSAGIRVGF